MQHSKRGGGTRRTPDAINKRTDALEARWGSLPEVEVSLGLRVRLDRSSVSRLGGEVIA